MRKAERHVYPGSVKYLSSVSYKAHERLKRPGISTLHFSMSMTATRDH